MFMFSLAFRFDPLIVVSICEFICMLSLAFRFELFIFDISVFVSSLW